MELKYGNVKLRAIERKDCELLKMLMNSALVEKMTVGWARPISTITQEKWMEQYTDTDCEMRWMIELSNNVTLGMMALTDIDWKSRYGVLGIKTNPYERRRIEGDTKDASYAVIRYAFEELGLHRIDSFLLGYNRFSKKLNESLGFCLEGVQKEKIFKCGKWNDIYCYGLLLSDYIHYDDGHAPWQVKEDKTK